MRRSVGHEQNTRNWLSCDFCYCDSPTPSQFDLYFSFNDIWFQLRDLCSTIEQSGLQLLLILMVDFVYSSLSILDVLARQLSMVWMQLDDSLGDIPGWDQYRTNVYIILSAIEQITSGNGTTGEFIFNIYIILSAIKQITSVNATTGEFLSNISIMLSTIEHISIMNATKGEFLFNSYVILSTI